MKKSLDNRLKYSREKSLSNKNRRAAIKNSQKEVFASPDTFDLDDENFVDVSKPAEPLDRGRLHAAIQYFLESAGNFAFYSSTAVSNAIAYLADLTGSIGGPRSIFDFISGFLTVTKYIGYGAFKLIFSIHPNVVGPLLGLVTSQCFGYLLGSFVGGKLWPSYEITDKLYSLITFNTGFSLAGGSGALVSTLTTLPSLSRYFGEMADSIFLVRPSLSSVSHMIKKSSYAVVGGTMIVLHASGILSAAQYMGAYEELSTKLYGVLGTGPLGVLSTIVSLAAIKRPLEERRYYDATTTAATQIFLNLIMKWLTGGAVGETFNYVKTLINGGELTKALIAPVKELAGRGYNLGGQVLDQSEKAVADVMGVVFGTPKPDTSLWSNIVSYFNSLVNGIYYFFVQSPYGLILATACASCWLMFWLLGKNSNWSESKKAEELKPEMKACVLQFTNVTTVTSTFIKNRFNKQPSDRAAVEEATRLNLNCGGSSKLQQACRLILDNQEITQSVVENYNILMRRSARDLADSLKGFDSAFNLEMQEFLLPASQELNVLEAFPMLADAIYTPGKTNDLARRSLENTSVHLLKFTKATKAYFLSRLERGKVSENALIALRETKGSLYATDDEKAYIEMLEKNKEDENVASRNIDENSATMLGFLNKLNQDVVEFLGSFDLEGIRSNVSEAENVLTELANESKRILDAREAVLRRIVEMAPNNQVENQIVELPQEMAPNNQVENQTVELPQESRIVYEILELPQERIVDETQIAVDEIRKNTTQLQESRIDQVLENVQQQSTINSIVKDMDDNPRKIVQDQQIQEDNQKTITDWDDSLATMVFANRNQEFEMSKAKIAAAVAKTLKKKMNIPIRRFN